MSRKLVVKIEVELHDDCDLTPTVVGRTLVQRLNDWRQATAAARKHLAKISFAGAREERPAAEEWRSIAQLLESNVIPADVAAVLERALAKARERADADGDNAGPAWRWLELIAADFLAAP